MARVPDNERMHIVELHMKQYSQRTIARLTGRPLKTVSRIIHAYKNERRIKDAPRNPRP